jgi:tetratricopeptide (TPR) repeat protein
MMNIRHRTAALLFLPLLLMTGCKAEDAPLAGKALDSLAGKDASAEARLSTAAANAIAEGKTDEALALYERLYNDNTSAFLSPDKDSFQEIALNYAQLLRKTGKAPQALTVLSPFLVTKHGLPKTDVDAVILNEYAATNIELGNFETAEETLNNVLANEDAKEFHADADNLLGITLDVEGKHKEAEDLLRKSLTLWKGDATSVMNNLAVCLASQGKFDESLMTLRQAVIMAPDKKEIARNIQIVEELRAAVLPKPSTAIPKKKKK